MLTARLFPNRIPANCAFTTQHSDPANAQKHGASTNSSLGMPNGGLQVVNPSQGIYALILKQLTDPAAIDGYEFADQSMLGDMFRDQWVSLPYVYNALKTLRWDGVHSEIWRDDEVKNVHLILSPKAWDEEEGTSKDETHKWWWKYNRLRLDDEKAAGIEDGF